MQQAGEQPPEADQPEQPDHEQRAEERLDVDGKRQRKQGGFARSTAGTKLAQGQHSQRDAESQERDGILSGRERQPAERCSAGRQQERRERAEDSHSCLLYTSPSPRD